MFGPAKTQVAAATEIEASRAAPALVSAPAVANGWLSIVWGDSSPELNLTSVTHYYLNTADGEKVELVLTPETEYLAGTLLQLNRQNVSVSGTRVQNANDPRGAASIALRSIEASGGAEASRLPELSGAQPWISILCKFSDVSTEPKNLSYFQNMFSSSYPGLDHYWRQISYNIVNVNGSGAVGWYTLPHARSYYVPSGGSANLDQLFTDCTNVANAAVNFANFTGINLMFNGELDGYAWGGGHYATLDGVSKVWNTTWEPPWGYSEITVMSHEMGHGFGLPHSSGNYGATYDNQWDVMSDTWTTCSRLTDATYGCLGQGTISYHLDLLAWMGARKYIAVSGSQNITLERINQPQTNNYLMAKIPIGSSTTRFYTVEARKWSGYDVKLPGEAVIIHEVDTTRGNPARVIDIDNNGNTGDGGAMWLPGETFNDSTNSISVTINSATSTGWNITINKGSGPSCTPNASVTSYPGTIAPNGTVTVNWNVSGSGCNSVSHTNIHWDTVPRGGSDPNAYTNFEDVFSGDLGNYSDSFTAPSSGSIYFIIHAIVDGVEITTSEYSIAVQSNSCTPSGNPPSAAIPNSGAWVEVSAVIDNAPLDATLENLRVRLDIDHPSPDKLELRLVNNASGQQVDLGRLNKTGALPKATRDGVTAFNGQPVNGTWTLRVRDTGSGQNGQIKNFAVRPEYAYNGPPLELRGDATGAKPLALRLSENLKQGQRSKEGKTAKRDEGNARAPEKPDANWQLLKYETFEGAFPNSGWSVLGGTTGGQEMYWDDDDARPHAGSWAAWPANGGANGIDPAVYCYPNNLDTWMIYGPFDLSDADDAATLFDLWRSIETGYDYVFFGVSGDGTNFNGYAWDGHVDWDTEVIYYGSYIGDSSVWVGWYFHSDGSVPYPGPWIDEIAVWKSVVNTPQVYVDSVRTTNRKNVTKTTFKRGAKMSYHAVIRNPGSTTCQVYSTWKAKGGTSKIMMWKGYLDIDPGTWDYRLDTTIPTTAPARSYKFTVNTNCGGQVSSASTNFTVVAGLAKQESGEEGAGVPERMR